MSPQKKNASENVLTGTGTGKTLEGDPDKVRSS